MTDDRTPCDQPRATRIFTPDGDPNDSECTCIICSRCHRHTGNDNQGHYWGFCSKTHDESNGFHFCCPTLPCEPEKAATP